VYAVGVGVGTVLNRDFGDHIEWGLNRRFTAPQPVPPEEWFLQHLTLSGDGSTIEMAVDGTTPKNFDYTVPAGKRLIVNRCMIVLIDGNIAYENFAGTGAVLTNGLLLQYAVDGSVFTNWLDNPIVKTSDFGRLAGTDIGKIQSSVGADPDVSVMRWTLARAGYVPLFEAGTVIRVVVQDNLTSLVSFEWILQGRLFDL
jgi:hypothetical protein